MVKILLVDDDKDIVETIKAGLTSRGFEVVIYEDPKKALLNFQPKFYDLILLDIKMPGMDGFELHNKLKLIDREAKINFLTGMSFYSNEPKRIISDLSGKNFIAKPVTN